MGSLLPKKVSSTDDSARRPGFQTQLEPKDRDYATWKRIYFEAGTLASLASPLLAHWLIDSLPILGVDISRVDKL